MNRTILIVICDFLLVSLLAFSTVDINKLSEVPETSTRTPQMQMVTTNQIGGNEGTRDLANVMRLALDEERRDRERLAEELARARKESETRDTQLQSFENNLRSTQETNRLLDAALQQFQQRLRAAAETNRSLDTAMQQVQMRLQTTEQANLRLVQEQATLQRQFTSAQNNIDALNQKLVAAASQTLSNQSRVTELEAELKRELGNAAALKQQISQVQQTNQLLATERQQLSGRLQAIETEKRVIEAEKKIVTQQVAKMEEFVQVERKEKAKLADGVKTLAESSTQLVQEIRENRPLAPNTIFTDFLTNRVSARFTAWRNGIIDTTRRRDTQTLVVNDGTNLFAVTHVSDTPLVLSSPGANWDRITGSLRRNDAEVPIRTLSFYFEDPRLILIPVTPEEAEKLGSKVYKISSEPYKFQDAVLVGTTEAYYGECRFQVDPSAPSYVRLDRSFLRGLFGQFNPSKGDIVFSRSGEALGIMANDTYCLMLRDFTVAATLRLGPTAGQQQTGDILSRLYGVISRKPMKLQ